MRFAVLILLFPLVAFGANPYWVSPTGAASWASSQSATPLTGTACASLATLNATIAAGDTAYFRGGTYNTHIKTVANGASNSVITLLAYTGETPVISNSTSSFATYYNGLYLTGKSWFKVIGITFQRDDANPDLKSVPLAITAGGSFNEIGDCIFDGRFRAVAFLFWDGGTTPHPLGTPCIHNWIHGCTFKNNGEPLWNGTYVDDAGGMQVGIPFYDDTSSYNTFENCTFSNGGHHTLEIFTKFNVFRNNVFYNPGWMTNLTGQAILKGADTNGLWGNRNLQLYDSLDNEGMYNLFEGNRFGTSGPPPDDDGGDGLTITSPKNLIRYNVIYNALNNGVLFKEGFNSKSYTNRFYNNTIYGSGRYQNDASWQGANLRWYGGYTNRGTVIKNNIFYRYGGAAEMTATVANYQNYGLVITNNWWTTNGNPSFTSTNLSNWTNSTEPNFRLNVDSGAISAGQHLTLTDGAGSATTALTVDDALYFQDGTWGSLLAGHLPDRIAVGTVTNIATVAVINYATQSITMTSPLSWADNDPVWLYSRNDGTEVLYGSAPELGAYEYPPFASATNQVRLMKSPSSRRR